MLNSFKVEPTDALIIIDPQNDFCPGGSLAVSGGDEIMPLINDIASMFRTVVITQDWHPQDQISFASNHHAAPFTEFAAPYGAQVLWPDHCVQGTKGAELHPTLNVLNVQAIIRKGTNPAVDSYSAFYENDGVTTTGLGPYLKALGIKRVVLVGLAYDFCVGFSALDAVQKAGLEGAVIVKDATRAIDMGGSVEAIEAKFAEAGVFVINSGLLV